jgi:hypothetical protein
MDSPLAQHQNQERFMPAFEKTKRNQVVRLPERGSYDQETIYPIIDEAIFCHVGFIQDNQPFVIPTLHDLILGCLE